MVFRFPNDNHRARIKAIIPRLPIKYMLYNVPKGLTNTCTCRDDSRGRLRVAVLAPQSLRCLQNHPSIYLIFKVIFM